MLAKSNQTSLKNRRPRVGNSCGELSHVRPLRKPYPAEEMRAYPISARVNNVKNDGPELIEPA